VRRVTFLFCLCLLAVALNTDATAGYGGTVVDTARLDVFTKFHPTAQFYGDVRFNPACDSKKSFPQMIKIPNFENAWQIVYDCKKYRIVRVSRAMRIFYTGWKAKFGDPEDRVWKQLSGLLVEWSPEKKVISSAYTIDGKKLENPTIVGLAITAGMIWVYASDEPVHNTIGNTAFIHELVHISLWSMDPLYKPDPDHEGDKYAGWTKEHSGFVIDTNLRLMENGL